MLVLAAGACRRGEPAPADAGAARPPPPAAADELARWQLAREREALEWERSELERQLAADAAVRAQAQAQAAAELDELRLDLARREQELAAREEDAAAAPEAPPPPAPEWPAAAGPLPDAGLDWADAEPLPEPEPVADFGTFYDDLEPYGEWFDSADYGYVWRPLVVVQSAGWHPYRHGRWAWTDCGWTWLSDEPFGWATCHYGHWALLAGHGWVWVPGTAWAPAWVCWRQGGDHIGWAPLPPECRGDRRPLWGAGVEREFGIGADWFCFVRLRHFGGPLGPHRLPVGGNRALLDSTTNITLIRRGPHRVWVGGPDHADLGRRLGRRLPAYTLAPDLLEESLRRPAIRDGHLRIYAPTVAAAWNPLLRPRHVSGQLGRAVGEAARDGAAGRWTELLQTRREGERRAAERQLARLDQPGDLTRLRAEQLRDNRERAGERARATAATTAAAPPARSDAGPPTPDAAGPAPGPDRAGRDSAGAGPVAVRTPDLPSNPVADADRAATGQPGRPWGQRTSRREQASDPEPPTAAGRNAATPPTAETAETGETTGREAAEEQRRLLDDQRRQQAAESQRRQAAEDQRRLLDDQRRQQAEESQRRQAAEEQRRQFEDQRRQQAAESQRRQAAEEQRRQFEDQRRQQAAESQRRQADEEQRRQLDDQRRQQADDLQRRQAPDRLQQPQRFDRRGR